MRDGRGFPRAGRATLREIPRSRLASPRKTRSFPTLLLRLEGTACYADLLLAPGEGFSRCFFGPLDKTGLFIGFLTILVNGLVLILN